MKKQPTKKPKAGTSTEAANERKALFIEAYIANGGNATQAATAAGYSPKTAYSQGNRLLKDVEIQQSLSKRQQKLAKQFELDTEKVLAQLAQIVYADPRKCFGPDGCLLPVREWPDEVAAMVSSVEVDALFEGTGKDRKQIGVTQKVKFWDKNSAIEKAMKHLGQFEKDNKQRNAFELMNAEQLDRFIQRKQEELQNSQTVH
jgi:phage terminase small subunit